MRSLTPPKYNLERINSSTPSFVANWSEAYLANWYAYTHFNIIHRRYSHMWAPCTVKSGESPSGGPPCGERLKVKLIYGYILCIHTQCYSKRERWNVFSTSCVSQMFKHGKGKLITCIAPTLIRIINAILDPTKMHFGEWCSIHPTSSLLQIRRFGKLMNNHDGMFLSRQISSRAAMAEYLRHYNFC